MTNREQGGVSIFIVIFTALLITIVVTSFTQVMVRNQQQATNNDLSQSAYDAALAGVEDAKRLLIKLKECEKTGDDPCVNTVSAAIKSSDCSTLQAAGIVTFNDGEVQVGAEALNQAYTCVKIQMDRPYVDGKLDADKGSKTLQLKSEDPFRRIRISWYTTKDIEDANSGQTFLATSPPFASDPTANSQPLHTKNNWDPVSSEKTTPPIMRAQLIQFRSGSINLGDFSSKGAKNARTAFLYPNFDSTLSGAQDYLSTRDKRLDASGTSLPRDTKCDRAGSYMCSVTLELPNPEGGNPNNREAYLQLSAMYNATSFKIELLDSSDDVVDFDDVQPLVDSTGRASDLFRRVQASVSIANSPLPVPEAALQVNGDVCKNFSVTNNPDDYRSECATE